MTDKLLDTENAEKALISIGHIQGCIEVIGLSLEKHVDASLDIKDLLESLEPLKDIFRMIIRSNKCKNESCNS